MRQLTTTELKSLLAIWATLMQKEQEKLTHLDSLVGDGDLGLTMSDGFSAAYDEIKEYNEKDIGLFFYLAGKKMSTVVPSTMGTLMASGLMQVGKTFKGKTTLAYRDFLALFTAYFDGVQGRGKAKIGEKTFLDGLYPAIESLQNNHHLDGRCAAELAVKAAQAGVSNTQMMVAIHGRAATRGEASRRLVDPGAYVALLLVQGYAEFVYQQMHE